MDRELFLMRTDIKVTYLSPQNERSDVIDLFILPLKSVLFVLHSKTENMDISKTLFKLFFTIQH